MEERKLKNTVTVEDIENLILAFLDSCHADYPDLAKQELWKKFYLNMTELYVDGRLIG